MEEGIRSRDLLGKRQRPKTYELAKFGREGICYISQTYTEDCYAAYDGSIFGRCESFVSSGESSTFQRPGYVGQRPEVPIDRRC